MFCVAAEISQKETERCVYVYMRHMGPYSYWIIKEDAVKKRN